ncbi:unnamed protein product [Ixodes pacificus]
MILLYSQPVIDYTRQKHVIKACYTSTHFALKKRLEFTFLQHMTTANCGERRKNLGERRNVTLSVWSNCLQSFIIFIIRRCPFKVCRDWLSPCSTEKWTRRLFLVFKLVHALATAYGRVA